MLVLAVFGFFSYLICTILETLLVADNGTRNEDAWAALGQPFGFMFFQHIDRFSCQISNALKGSLKGTYLVSLLELDQ